MVILDWEPLSDWEVTNTGNTNWQKSPFGPGDYLDATWFDKLPVIPNKNQ